MKSYSAYFIQAASVAELESRAGGAKPLASLFNAVAVPGSKWIVCGYDTQAAPPEDDALLGTESLTLEKSKTLGDVIHLFADRSTEGFFYEHSKDGVLQRKLVWFPLLEAAGTPGWICVQGNSEPWEEPLFFTTKRLDEVLRFSQLGYEDREMDGEAGALAQSPARESVIREIWAKRELAEKSTLPSGDHTVALVVEKHFGLALPPSQK